MARPDADPSGQRARRRRRRILNVRGDRDPAVHGATVVRAVVHARLLGLRLLTLDARVVVAPAEVQPSALDLMAPLAVDHEPAPGGRIGEGAPPVGSVLVVRPPPTSADVGVTRARELLAEGADTLTRASRETSRFDV